MNELFEEHLLQRWQTAVWIIRQDLRGNIEGGQIVEQGWKNFIVFVFEYRVCLVFN